MVAILAGFAPALLAQTGFWYSEAEAARRLAHIQEIAALSGGKIEITVIRMPDPQSASTHGPLTRPDSAERPSTPELTASPAPESTLLLDPSADSLSAPAAQAVPWGAEFVAPQDPDKKWREQFDLALALEETKSWREALIVLLHLSDTYPDHPRRGDCFYEMGECLTALSKPALAQRAFRQVLQYPGSSFYDDALLRLAAALVREGHAAMAHPYLERLLSTLPESEFAPLAQALLKAI
ncbi:MAG TPA: hypothetical protein PLG50_12000 [bacterium]|nr:hypothetical protein [bacterium]HQG46372.1 hypothetical protein [bacterium]HQI48143.1 hypothetical protein [bacterium]HQJ65826.1 hypothetical protein [bacterium]